MTPTILAGASTLPTLEWREQMEAHQQAERRGELPFQYLGGTPGSPIITRDQYGRPLNPMTTPPNGARKATFR